MAKARATAVIRVQDEATRNVKKIGQQFGGLEKKAKSLGSALRFAADAKLAADGITQLGNMAQRALEGPLNTFVDFEDQMARVGALSNATAGEMALLTNKARELGRDTRFSATQAAEGMGYLAMAGFNATQQMQAMPGMLTLAAAGATDLGRTADIASDILSGFGLKAEQMGLVGDVLAKTFTSSNTSLEMLGETMKYVGPVARTAGADIQTVSAMAGLLANVGIKSSSSGTALRAMFLRLAAPSGKLKKHMQGLGASVEDLGRGREALKFLGIEVNDKAGNMKAIDTLLKEVYAAVEKRGLGSGDKLNLYKKIFGEEAASAAAELIAQAGAGGLDEYIKKVRDSEGTNEKIAKRMNATTKGLLTALKSTWEDANIEIGEALAPQIRELSKSVRETVASFTAWARENPGVVQGLGKMLIAVASIAAVMGPFVLTMSALKSSFVVLRLAVFPATAALAGFQKVLLATRFASVATATTFGALTAPMWGAVAAAGAAGVAFGMWLDKTFALSDKLSDLMADITGVNNALHSLGGRRNTRTMGADEDQHFADGTVKGADGSIKVKGSEWQRHAEGLSKKEWDAREAAKANGGTKADVDMKVEVDIKDTRTEVKTTRKARNATVQLSAGQAMVGSGA